MSSYEIFPLTPQDTPWVKTFMRAQWGSERVAAHGVVYLPHELPGFYAVQDGERVGLLTYHLEGDACEIVTLNSLRAGQGIGSALIQAVGAAACKAGCARLWLITTNDNLHALGFYQKRGFRLAALRPGAVDAARRLKPEIPLVGENGIEIRDEIELEKAEGGRMRDEEGKKAMRESGDQG